jgi:hypothetical protein
MSESGSRAGTGISSLLAPIMLDYMSESGFRAGRGTSSLLAPIMPFLTCRNLVPVKVEGFHGF